MGDDPKSTAKAILGMSAPPSGDVEDEPMPMDDIDSEDAALDAAADEAFAAVQSNDAEAFRSAFKSAFRAVSGM